MEDVDLVVGWLDGWLLAADLRRRDRIWPCRLVVEQRRVEVEGHGGGGGSRLSRRDIGRFFDKGIIDIYPAR